MKFSTTKVVIWGPFDVNIIVWHFLHFIFQYISVVLFVIILCQDRYLEIKTGFLRSNKIFTFHNRMELLTHSLQVNKSPTDSRLIRINLLEHLRPAYISAKRTQTDKWWVASFQLITLKLEVVYSSGQVFVLQCTLGFIGYNSKNLSFGRSSIKLQNFGLENGS